MTVPAEAVVRSRDGRSVLDHDGSEPLSAFTPDPDRVRAAVEALEGHGLTVDGVDGVAVRFHGPPEAFHAAFGVALDRVDHLWQVAGRPGRTTFDVPADLPLGGALAAVLLAQPLRPAARSWTLEEVFVGADEPLPRDLLLGEVGATLGAAFPGRAAFPADVPVLALAKTLDLFQDWQTELHGLLAAAAGPASSAGRPPLRAVIVDEAAPPGLGRLWGLQRAAGDRPVPLPVIDGREPSPTDDGIWAVDDGEAAPHRFFLHVWPAWSEVVRQMEAFRGTMSTLAASPRPADTAALDLVRQRWGSTRDAVVALLGRLDLLDAATPGPGPARSATDALAVSVRAMTGLVAGLTAASVPDAVSCWDDIVAYTAIVEKRIRIAERVYGARFAARLDDMHLHAAMVTNAFLAVSQDLVDLRVRYQPGRSTRATGRRTVSSRSFGTALGDLDDESVAALRATAAARRQGRARHLELTVVAVGNNTAGDPGGGRDAPSMNAVVAADADNVLVVGGCAPAEGGWRATRATHGYTIGLPTGPKHTVVAVRVPHICATTKATTGGSVIFPDAGVPPRWWTGGGSSLSTPIVAAVCSLVWAAFPGLTAQKVKDAVLSSTSTLTGGTFARPTEHDRRIVGSARMPGDGTKRVRLDDALAAAATMSSADLRAAVPGVSPAHGTGARS